MSGTEYEWNAVIEMAAEIGITLATVLLVAATWNLGRQAKKHGAEMKAERMRKETPFVVGWLQWTENDLTRGNVPLLWLVLENVGEGAAKDLKWWFEDVNEEQWEKRRIGGAYWPDSEERAGGQRILPGGRRISMVLTGGRSLTVEPGTRDDEWEKHKDVEPFTLRLKYKNMKEEEVEPAPTKLNPSELYRRGGGAATSPLAEIAWLMRKAWNISGPWYSEHPDGGRAAKLRAGAIETGTAREGVNTEKPDNSRTDVTGRREGYKVGPTAKGKG